MKDWFLKQSGLTCQNFMRKAKTQTELRLTEQTKDKSKFFKAQEKWGMYWHAEGVIKLADDRRQLLNFHGTMCHSPR